VRVNADLRWRSRAVDGFLVESRLAHWNTVRVLPSHTIQQGMEEIESGKPLF
jgi:hypothetical protein